MTVSTRRVWRAAPTTRAVVWGFLIVAGVGLPVLAYLLHLRGGAWLPVLLVALALAAVLYAWRFGLHPRLSADDAGVTVVNPWTTTALSWSEITLVAPGENGLVIGTEDSQVEAWCIQKSGHAANRVRRARSDAIVDELLDLLDAHDLPLEGAPPGLSLHRARPDESRLLTRIERAASEASFSHIFDPATYPYPSAEVARRWRRLLTDRLTRVRILRLHDAPVGFVAFTADTVLHLSVAPEHSRRGYGSALLRYATREMFDGGVPSARLWVLADNSVARRFYASLGWRETGQQRPCEYSPYPAEIELARPNPAAPRRVLHEQTRP